MSAKVKTCQLSGRMLDWACVQAERKAQLECSGQYNIHHPFEPSKDGRAGALIIEREGINTRTLKGWAGEMKWQATINDEGPVWYGATMLIAAMRCFVGSKLGDEIEIPEGLGYGR